MQAATLRVKGCIDAGEDLPDNGKGPDVPGNSEATR